MHPPDSCPKDGLPASLNLIVAQSISILTDVTCALSQFNTVESYDIHLSHFHKGMDFYKCIKCNKRYISLPEFQSHVMEVSS